MKTVHTITADIYVGRREGYGWRVHDLDEIKLWLHNYCDQVGYCVTVTETEFIYKNGGEPGCTVGLINYPRFPASWEAIRDHAFAIAKGLMKLLKQQKVTVVMGGYVEETYMFTPEDLEEVVEQAA